MPLTSLGSVRPRLSVRFSRVSAVREPAEVDFQGLDAAGVEPAQGLIPAHHPHRHPFLPARLGEEQRAIGKIQGAGRTLARDGGPGIPPLETARDHEVDHGVQIVVQVQSDALADASDAPYAFAHEFRDRWIEGLEQRRRAETDALHRLPGDAGIERVDVEADLRKFGHAERSMPRAARRQCREVCPDASLAPGLQRGPDRECDPLWPDKGSASQNARLPIPTAISALPVPCIRATIHRFPERLKIRANSIPIEKTDRKRGIAVDGGSA